MNRLLLLLTILFCILSITGTADGQQYRIDTLARAPMAQYPVCIAFSPKGDGSFFFTEKNSGRVRLFRGSLQPAPLLTVPVETEGPQGLLGIAVHPSYPDTPYVYVFYVRAEDRMGIVARFRDSSGVGVDPTPIAIIPRRDAAAEHNGGILRFGPDRKLYVAVGDHRAHPESAQDTSSRHAPWGKILRLNSDGSFPADNPSPLKPFWALGLRNCQGLAFDDETGSLYCTDGGTSAPNAIYRVRKGDNFGWPRMDGDPSGGRVPALFTFPAENAPDLTAIAVYRGNAFPRLRGKLLVAASAVPAIWTGTFVEGTDSLAVERFLTFPTGFSDLQIGPDGCLYLVNGPYLSNRILRISPVAPRFITMPPPEAVQGVRFSYTPAFAGTPPEITLLTGPDGMTLDQGTGTVQWMPSNAQALGRSQTFTIRARNGAGAVLQRSTIAVVNVNDPPTPFTLRSPAAGEPLSYFGRDPEVILRWDPAIDPDGEPVLHVVSVDTIPSFTSSWVRSYEVGTADSLRILLPRATQKYYWQVTASDGRYTTRATPDPSTFSITVPAPVAVPIRATHDATPAVRESPVAVQTNPATSVAYTLTRTGHVRIAVFNIFGQEIMRVTDATQQEGAYVVDLSKLDLPNGMYFYRLQAPGIFETKKVVLAR